MGEPVWWSEPFWNAETTTNGRGAYEEVEHSPSDKHKHDENYRGEVSASREIQRENIWSKNYGQFRGPYCSHWINYMVPSMTFRQVLI